MPKPFANSAQITYSLVNGDWLLGIQTGNSTGDAGLPQMKHIKLSQLSDWVRGTYGQVWRYRGPFSASLPSDAQANDYFLATATFTVDSVTYTKDHLYAYNASGTWDDISDVLSQYASQAQVTDIDDRLTVVEVKVDAMGDGVVYKGEVATYADLAGIVDPQTGWEYFVTANASFYIYNGSSWDQIDNAVVQTITDGDTAHAPSGDAVYDALASEASARESADSHLLSAISFNRKRIENLEQKSGSVVDVDYPDYSVYGEVPTGKAKNAIVSKLRGVTVAWDQLNDYIINTSTSTYSVTTASDGKITATITSESTTGNVQISTAINCIVGHKYLLLLDKLKEVNGNFFFRAQGTYESSTEVYTQIASKVGTIVACAYAGSLKMTVECRTVYTQVTSYPATAELYPKIVDLTQMFGPQVADYLYSIEQGTAGAGVALFKALVSAQDNSHETGRLVSTTYSAVKSIHKNLLDYSTVSHPSATIVLNDDGSVTVSATYGAVAIEKLLTKTIGSGTYTFSNIAGLQAYVQVGSSSDYSHLVNIGASYTFNYDGTSYLRILYNNQSSGTTITYKAQLELGSSSTSYSPYGTLGTLPLPTSVTLRGILKVVNNALVVDGDEYDPETGEIERNYGIVDLGTLTLEYQSNYPRFRASFSGFMPSASSSSVADILCAFYEATSMDVTQTKDKTIALGATGINYLYFHDNAHTDADLVGGKAPWLDGVMLVYKLANPTSDTPIDPVLDPTLATEGGGTLSTTQTNDPAIVSAMEMTYMTL